MGSIKQIAVVKLLLFFSTAVLEFLELGSKYVDLSLFAMLLHSVPLVVQRSKLKLKLCMHDNNRTATFEKELNHNQESYLLFHRCASTKTSLPRLLQIEIWPPLCPQWGLSLYEVVFIYFRNMQKHETVPRVVLFPKLRVFELFDFNIFHLVKKVCINFSQFVYQLEKLALNNQASYKTIVQICWI